MTEQRGRRLAIIGCGAVVSYHLVPALKRIGWIPNVLIDTSPARLDLVAAKLGRRGRGVLKGKDWHALASDFDAAIVAVPPALHGPIGSALLQSGKHVFMEKPLATRAAEARAMVEIATRNNLALSVGLLRRYLRAGRWLKALVASRTLGAIRRVEVREGFAFNWDIASVDTIRPDSAGGGVLMDTGAHTVDQLLWWLGPVNLVSYQDDSQGGVEADCRLTFDLPEGGSGDVELSRTRNLRNSILIEGTNGSVETHLFKNEVLACSKNVLGFRHGGVGVVDMKPQLFPELFDAELQDFHASALNGQVVGIAGRDALQSIEVIERCYASRKPLRLPWTKPATATRRSQIEIGGLFRESRVLVTGASGFIGGRLVECLVREHGARVRCLVRNLGHSTRLARLPVEIVGGNLADEKDVRSAVKDMDYIFHCAYDTQSLRQNLDGIDVLLRASTEEAARRFIHVSTFSVYEPFSDGPLTEDSADGDRSWSYVRTKLELERRVFQNVQSGGVPATVVQPTIVYGPFCKPWTNWPAEMLIYGEVVLPDAGQGLCNAVHVDDVVDGMLRAAAAPNAPGERFMLSGPHPVTWATFFEAFAKALDVRPPTYWPRELIVRSNRGALHDARMILSDPRKIIQIIVRLPAARSALQAGLDAMPSNLRGLIMHYYQGSGERRLDERYLPNSQLLSLYCSKAHVQCDKASRLLSYTPQIAFHDGIALTQPYLNWMFGDAKRSVQARRRSASLRGVQSADVVRAD